MIVESAAAPVLPTKTIGRRITLHTYALLAILFLFATGGAFLTSRGSENVTATAQSGGALHTIELAIAFGLSVPMILSRWRDVANLALKMKFFSALAVLATISCFWSQDPSLSLRSGIYLTLNTLFAFYLVRRFSPDDLMRHLMLLGIVVAVVSLTMAVALPKYAFGPANSSLALQGVFGAKNILGHVAVLLLTPVFFVRNMAMTPKVGYCLLMFALIIPALSLQAWVAALFCFAFAGCSMLYRRLRKRDFLWIVYVIVIPLVVSLALLAGYWNDVLGYLGKDPTLSGRTMIWSAVLQSVAKKPLLGWGYDAVWRGFVGESASIILFAHFTIAQAQNGVLEVLLGLGSVGLAFVLATIVEGLRNASICTRSGSSHAGFWYLLILCITLFYSLGEAVFNIQNNLQWILYMVACSGLALEARPLRRSSTTVNSTNRNVSSSESFPKRIAAR